MSQNLTERLNKIIRNLRGQGRITPENIQETLREVRIAFLEADVALSVTREFIDKVKERALGQEVMQSLTPGQAVIKIIHDELIATMSDENQALNLSTTPPAVILMAGLQGSGKTTSTAKLARWLKESMQKTVMVVSTDIYRPAAIDQLRILAQEVDVVFFPSDAGMSPIDIAKEAIKAAKLQFIDVVLVDTAGRLHIDQAMMDEIKAIHQAANPIETLFVVDSMTGQDAANTAKAFHDALPLTGVILTKTDGDARGGAALSIRAITGKPIKFVGVGEKMQALSPFYPERIASRILDMGDIVSLVEEAEKHVDKEKAAKLATKLKKGKGFNLEDFLDQLEQMENMGGIGKLLDKLPGMTNMQDKLKGRINDSMFVKKKAIIRSMRPKERRHPDLIKNSHKRRIAAGSGTSIQEVNKLLKEFEQMQKMMKKFSGGGLAKLMKQFKGKMPMGM
ncbi:MAG: signal recognition particle protein [Gammaproteobacteria bacterium]|nr:signal recognition particle protein [Gammaproteobacteria bacterium]